MARLPKDVRGLVVFMIAGTLCLLLLIVIVAWAIMGPERIPAAAREHFAQLLILLVGLISGYLLGKSNGPR